MEKALKFDPKKCEVETVDKIAEDLEDAASRHNSELLTWHVNELRRGGQSGLPIKGRSGATISDKERVKESWEEHFENMLNRDIVAREDIEESADSVVNEFLKYGGPELRNKLLKIMNMIYEKGEILGKP